MQKYIEIFPIASVILFFIYMSCNEETHPETSPYEEAQLISYFSSDTCLPDLRQYNDTAEVEIVIDSFDINIVHKNAYFNCCLDSIRTEFTQNGNTLKLTEVEYRIGGCYCTCPYEISATIQVSESGTYLIEISAIEVNAEEKLIYQEWVEVPGE